MIKLSDYLDYLNQQIVQARKSADEMAIQTAKEYAGHPYLKYFKVPRFAVPSIKMDVPVRISDISKIKEYQIDKETLLTQTNAILAQQNQKLVGETKIPLLKAEHLESKEMQQIFSQFTNNDRKLVVKGIKEMRPVVTDLVRNEALTNSDSRYTAVYAKVIQDVIEIHGVLTEKIKDLFLDPNTSRVEDKDKILLNLQIELVDESVRILTVKDSKGNDVEQIIFD